MPDKQNDWSADEAFWEEGWADMENRLDRKKRRGLLLPLFLGLLLLAVVGAGALVLGGSGISDGPGTELQAGREAVGSVERPTPDQEPTAESSAVTEYSDVQPEAVLPEPGPRETVPANPAPAVAQEDPATPPAPKEEETTAPPITAEYLVIDALTLKAISPLQIDLDLPALPDTTGNQPVVIPNFLPRYTLAGGVTVYPTSFLPGSYAQLTRRWSWGEWFVPVGLRYDYGRLAFRPDNEGDDYMFAPVVGPNTSANAGVIYPEDLTLTTHTIALRSGGGWSRGRLTLSGGGEVAYLLGGRGPTYTAVDSAGTVRVAVEEERFNGNYLSSSTADFANFGGQYRLPPSTTVNRFLFNAWLRADFRVSGSFHLSLGLTRGLTPFYRDDALRVEATRLDMGLLYTIR